MQTAGDEPDATTIVVVRLRHENGICSVDLDDVIRQLRRGSAQRGASITLQPAVPPVTVVPPAVPCTEPGLQNSGVPAMTAALDTELEMALSALLPPRRPLTKRLAPVLLNVLRVLLIGIGMLSIGTVGVPLLLRHAVTWDEPGLASACFNSSCLSGNATEAEGQPEASEPNLEALAVVAPVGSVVSYAIMCWSLMGLISRDHRKATADYGLGLAATTLALVVPYGITVHFGLARDILRPCMDVVFMLLSLVLILVVVAYRAFYLYDQSPESKARYAASLGIAQPNSLSRHLSRVRRAVRACLPVVVVISAGAAYIGGIHPLSRICTDDTQRLLVHVASILLKLLGDKLLFHAFTVVLPRTSAVVVDHVLFNFQLVASTQSRLLLLSIRSPQLILASSIGSAALEITMAGYGICKYKGKLAELQARLATHCCDMTADLLAREARSLELKREVVLISRQRLVLSIKKGASTIIEYAQANLAMTLVFVFAGHVAFRFNTPELTWELAGLALLAQHGPELVSDLAVTWLEESAGLPITEYYRTQLSFWHFLQKLVASIMIFFLVLLTMRVPV